MKKTMHVLFMVAAMLVTMLPVGQINVFAEETEEKITEIAEDTADNPEETAVLQEEELSPEEAVIEDQIEDTAEDSSETVTETEEVPEPQEVVEESADETTEPEQPADTESAESMISEETEVFTEELEQFNETKAAISSVTLTGVKKPAYGAYATTSGIGLASGSNCTITSIVWYDSEHAYYGETGEMTSSQSFMNHYTYQLRVTLSPNSGYSFVSKDSLSVTLSGISSSDYYLSVTGSGSDSRRFLWITFKAINAVPITSVSLSVLPAPSVGGSANYHTIGYKLSEHIMSAGTMYWEDLDSHVQLSSSDKFQQGKRYQFVMDIVPYPGHTFAAVSSITALWENSLFGYTTMITASTEKNSVGASGVRVSYIFPMLNPPIAGVLINFSDRPYVGDTVKPKSLMSPSYGSKFSITEVEWMNSSGIVSSTHKYLPGETYELRINITPDSGYAFVPAKDLNAGLNGIPSKKYEVFVDDSPVADNDRLLRFRFEMPYFSDVLDSSQFFYKPVYWGAAEGIVGGWDDGTFRPWNECNRAAIITFLWRLQGSTYAYQNTKSPYSDVDGTNPFYPAIMWGYETGIIQGYNDGTFRPWTSCNRAAIITFLWKIAGSPMTYANTKSPFSDVDGTNQFYPAIMWGYETGIIQGYEDGTFRPWNTCNRAAAVTFIYRYKMMSGS